MTTSSTAQQRVPGWFTAADCRLDDLRALVEVHTDVSEYPFADDVRDNVLVYGPRAYETARTPEGRRAVQAELGRALLTGPGVVVLSGAFDTAVVDRVSRVFETMVTEQRAAGPRDGDFFAPTGENDRVWRALDKLALRDPEAFAAYYATDALAVVSQAWLGRGYQITSQVNVVNPGGKAQEPHRDYHLGFMSERQCETFPAHVHGLSPLLTLQGAVAHCDMPVETGPTMLLPNSQKYPAGYLAYQQPEFAAYFQDHFVQLPLATGDAVFFNPAVFHGAGTNRSASVRRTANLLQISSPFGRAMETVDRDAMCRALYPVLLSYKASGVSEQAIENVVAASAEGYAFPTDLDRDPPVGGLAPASQADLVRTALTAGTSPEELGAVLDALARRRDL
ncbi:phytanoyl-CoA dioxygenase family protein [Kineosporia sp. R_H_3]|uniref:phytanoyl-CoA dioxygenase family protein n=1 Tax=Kineosporia sp. R_H_3 TaxID=1961848 RepID=UPI000B4AB574|nr:phytanoyl-CoA dioxygenase family protein [Kineosporia sp. R_H_3]